MNSSPTSGRRDRGLVYEQGMGQWSRQVAPHFLSWLGLPANQRWLDLGCGTGAVCAAVLNYCTPAAVIGVDPAPEFLLHVQHQLADGVRLLCGNATAIPLPDAAVDVVVSGLVLNFLPNRLAALAEMARVCRSGGSIAAYVWDGDGQMELLHHFWQAAEQLQPVSAPSDRVSRSAMSRGQALTMLFAKAGLHQPEATSIDITTRFSSFDDYWQPILRGQSPTSIHTRSLDESAQTRLRELLRNRLVAQADGSINLRARAWAVRGFVA